MSPARKIEQRKQNQTEQSKTHDFKRTQKRTCDIILFYFYSIKIKVFLYLTTIGVKILSFYTF